MTQKQMIELVQQQFPDVGETQIRVMINQALDEFVHHSRLLKSNGVVTTQANKRYYPLTLFSNVTDADDVLEIYRVEHDDERIPIAVGEYSHEDLAEAS